METTSTVKHYAVDLDISTDLDSDERLRVADLKDDLTKDLDTIEATLLVEHGPAGGWPIVRFEGSGEDIARLLVRYSDGDLFQVVDSGNAFALKSLQRL